MGSSVTSTARRPVHHRLRFRLLALIVLAFVGGVGSCLGRDDEGAARQAEPLLPTSTAPLAPVAAGGVSAPSSVPSSSRAAVAQPSTTTRAPRTTTTTSAAARRTLVPDVDDEPAPEPRTRTAEPAESSEDSGGSVYYENCAAVRAAGAAPIRRGQPGYRAGLDRDGDGQGCGSD